MARRKAKCQIRRHRLIYDPNYTIEQLCKDIQKIYRRKVSVSSMGDYELGNTEPPPSLLYILADHFGCEQGDLWAPDPPRRKRMPF